MKKVLLIAIAIISFSCSNAQRTQFKPEALDEKLTTLDEKEISFGQIIKNHPNQVVMIELWASWCGDCVKAMPSMKKLQENNKNVSYIFLSMDKTADKWKEGIEKHQIKGEHFLVKDGMKGSLGKALDVDWIPRYIIIDKTGKIEIYRAIETDFDLIHQTLQKLNK